MASAFLEEFKRRTEERWAESDVNPGIYGFQIVQGTRWLPGLSDREIRGYEAEAGVSFPQDFRDFLAAFNGTDRETRNVYGSSEPPRSGPGVYSYPRDLDLVKDLMSRWALDWEGIRRELEAQGTRIPETARCVPIYSHRGVLCSGDPRESKVLSIMGHDAIVY